MLSESMCGNRVHCFTGAYLSKNWNVERALKKKKSPAGLLKEFVVTGLKRSC